MAKLPLLLVTALISLAACSDDPAETTQPQQPTNNLTEEEVMLVIHCAEMQMPECEAFEGVTLSKEQIKQGCEIMPEMTICENSNAD